MSFLSSSSSSSAAAGPAKWEVDGGFLLYIAAVSYSFYLFAIVCDVYFVPALHVMCERLHLSDEFAGATLMAAGASCPELFSSFVGVLITHTPTGTGAVVGSEIFSLLFFLSVSVSFLPVLIIYLFKKKK